MSVFKYILILLFWIWASDLTGQIRIPGDTLNLPKDSLVTAETIDVSISKDAPDAEVVYSSVDSSYLDAQEKMFYLFGDAYR